MLTPGTKAPAFKMTTLTADGPAYVNLSDYAGKSTVVLLFFPMAFTGVCTTEFCDISNGLNAYNDLGATVLGVSGDSPFAQSNWAKKENISVTLLSDYDHSVTKAYGVAYDSFLPEKNLGQAGVPKRSAFIIDREGVIQYAESSDNPGQLPNFEAIKAKLAELK
jgi:glutaredoxin-dependent peroxiredoxin